MALLFHIAMAYDGLWWLGLMISKSLEFRFRLRNELNELSHIRTLGKSLAYRNLGGPLEYTTTQHRYNLLSLNNKFLMTTSSKELCRMYPSNQQQGNEVSCAYQVSEQCFTCYR